VFEQGQQQWQQQWQRQRQQLASNNVSMVPLCQRGPAQRYVCKSLLRNSHACELITYMSARAVDVLAHSACLQPCLTVFLCRPPLSPFVTLSAAVEACGARQPSQQVRAQPAGGT
jgi:hypothetical protein